MGPTVSVCRGSGGRLGCAGLLGNVVLLGKGFLDSSSDEDFFLNHIFNYLWCTSSIYTKHIKEALDCALRQPRFYLRI